MIESFSVKSSMPEELIDITDPLSKIVMRSSIHIKSSLIGCSETVIIENGRLSLGTWQAIYFCEFDGPRTRKVLVKII